MAVYLRQLARLSPLRKTVLAIVCISLIWLSSQRSHRLPFSGLRYDIPVVDDATTYETIRFDGYVNGDIPSGTDCKQVTLHGQELHVSKSLYIEDDIVDIAMEIKHPMIIYDDQPEVLEQVPRAWAIMAASSVWLEKYQVYFAVSRVYFHNLDVRHWSKISFLYAQIYDRSWTPLENFQISFHGVNITFPRILDIPIPHEAGGGFFGPEDPRLVLETTIDDPEPLIIFNMVVSPADKERRMHIHRPFSNFTTRLQLHEGKEHISEKNWMPFFVPQEKTPEQQAFPSVYIHFVYEWHALKILRCHVLNGICEWAYRQSQNRMPWEEYRSAREYRDTRGVMRGGTNFVPLTFSSATGMTSFVGFPRTHTDGGCFKEAIYRPVLTVLTTNGTAFWLDFVSAALDFGHAVLTIDEYNDVCDRGRILLANSITSYDENTDKMIVSFSVADATRQIAEIKGVRKLVEQLPHFKLPESEILQADVIRNKLNVTHDVLNCGVRSATDYAIEFTNVTDRSKPKEQQRLANLDHDGVQDTTKGSSNGLLAEIIT